MKRSGAAKFPNSVQLFKFCHKVLSTRTGTKVHDQEVGSILEFNPSDCSHWKRGEKNVRSVFSLAKLAETLQVDIGLIHDVASGACGLDEAFYEWQETATIRTIQERVAGSPNAEVKVARDRVEAFVAQLHEQADFTTPPLYIPEVMRFFAFVGTQPADMMDKLCRILRVRPGQYTIQYKKGDLRPQTRMCMTRELSKIVFQGERDRFPELGAVNASLSDYEELVFTASLLAPKALLLSEMAKLDSRKNIINELAALFWVPKSLVGFQLQDVVRSGQRPAVNSDAVVRDVNVETVSA